MEKRANAFAGSFLMPKNGIELFLASINKGGVSRRKIHLFDVATDQGIETEKRVLVSSQQIGFSDVALLAAHFGVSFQAAIYRLIDLEFISRDEMRELLTNESQMTEYLQSIGRIDAVNGKSSDAREIKRQIVPLAFEAFRQQKISKDKFENLIQVLEVENSQALTALVA
jgi:Zn-dependent peptidase ImmA (M78 family)